MKTYHFKMNTFAFGVRVACLTLACITVMGLFSAEAAPAKLSEEDICDCAESYIAPIMPGIWRMRTPDGEMREFFCENKSDKIRSEDGWRGIVTGDVVKVTAPKGCPISSWQFLNGRLDRVLAQGKWCGFEYPDPVVYHGEEVPALWPEREEIPEEVKDPGDLWMNDNRLRLWFSSPNQAGTLLALLATLGICGALSMRRWWKIPPAVIGLAAMVCLVLTKSRGSFVALAVSGLSAVLLTLHNRGACRRCMLTVFGGSVLAAAVVGAFILFGSGKDGAARTASDANRRAIVEAGARMFADGGAFGWNKFGTPGFVYESWYRDGDRDKSKAPRFNLVSDHLTEIAYIGWLRGWVYASCWSIGLVLLAWFAWRGGSVVPMALWSVLAAAAFFNVVLPEWTLWILPTASLLLLIPRWRIFADRRSGLAVVLGMVVAAAVIWGLHAYGAAHRPKRPTMNCQGDRLLLCGYKPRIWLVRDLKVLGMIGTGPTIRRYLANDRSSPGIGYVADRSAIPEDAAVDRLVLSGEHGRKFLDDYNAGRVVSLPHSVVFLAPDFPASEVPESLLKGTAVRYVIGEFAARYDPESVEYPKWVTVVNGAEVYIPRWMRYVVGGL